MKYLERLGLDPSSAVALVLITHWDDDHIRGIARVVETCAAARVACSAALEREDILQFVVEQEGSGGALGSGVDELRTVLTSAASRIVWAKANLPLHPRPPGDKPSVVALSPSEDAVARSIEALIKDATGLPVVTSRRFTAPEGPNGASVASCVRGADVTTLLGADLENSKNPETGWDAVLRYAKPESPASLVKVPHHASEGAHHDDVWGEMIADDPVAIVTPWNLGARFLPTQSDLERLAQLSTRVYLTAMPALGRMTKDPEVEKLLRKVHAGKVEELRGWGHVQARWRESETEWAVELRGDARWVNAP